MPRKLYSETLGRKDILLYPDYKPYFFISELIPIVDPPHRSIASEFSFFKNNDKYSLLIKSSRSCRLLPP